MYVFKIPAPTPNNIALWLNQLIGVPWLVALTFSTLWIVYRVFLVFQKPTEELEEVLGIDIPPVPDVALARITSNSILLYWKPPDNYNSTLKHMIQVNGINIGEFERSDATIQVTGLQPGNCYGVRAVATNQAGNSSYSSLIQVQTIPKSGHRAVKLLANSEHTPVKRTSQSRRVSHPLPTPEQSTSSTAEDRSGKDEANETQITLNKRLDALKRQLEESQLQAEEEIREAEASKLELMNKRDELKRSVEESEKASQDFRKQVNELEKQCKSAQRKKSAKERALQQKKAERQKMKDEIARWEAETQDTYQNAEDLRQQKTTIEKEHGEQMEKVQSKLEETQTECTRMEDELRDLGIKVKELDEQRAKADQEKYAAEAEAEKKKEEEEQASEERIQVLQIQYATHWKMLNDLEVQRNMEAERVGELLRLKDQNPGMFAPVPGLDYPIPPMFPTNQRIRQNVPRGTTVSFPNYVGGRHHLPFDNISNASPSLTAAVPHYGLGNTGSPDHLERPQLTQQEIEHLTGGAPMSPSANTLLPANLLGDDDEPRQVFGRRSPLKKESTDSRPQSFRPPSTDPKIQDPQSPRSINSKSPSLLSSPHESLSNIPGMFGRESYGDDDERSLPGPSGSPFSVMATSGAGSSRKISRMFNWSRREKPGLSEPPLLGSLKAAQSQSFPVNVEQDNDQGRRIWTNSVSQLWGKNSGAQSGDISHQLPQKTRRGIFGSSRLESSEAIEEPSRPSSTYSYGDSLVQQPQDYQQLGWGRSQSGHEWPTAGTGPWSHSQSRRQSLQHGSTSNLSIGSTPLDPNEEFTSPYLFKKSIQPAPIGTERYKIGQRSNTPKLNPAAPSFKTKIFARGDSKKALRGGVSNEFVPEKLKLRELDKSREVDSFSKSSSPSMSRKSQDTYSIVTTDSLCDSHESLEPSNSGTPSEPALTPNPSTPKETLMQRLTRKSSSTKFWGKDRSSKASSKGAPSTPGEAEFEDTGDYLGRSAESSGSTPLDKRGSLSWSRVMGKSKKKGDVAPSETSERASEAEAEDEE